MRRSADAPDPKLEIAPRRPGPARLQSACITINNACTRAEGKGGRGSPATLSRISAAHLQHDCESASPGYEAVKAPAACLYHTRKRCVMLLTNDSTRLGPAGLPSGQRRGAHPAACGPPPRRGSGCPGQDTGPLCPGQSRARSSCRTKGAGELGRGISSRQAHSPGWRLRATWAAGNPAV